MAREIAHEVVPSAPFQAPHEIAHEGGEQRSRNVQLNSDSNPDSTPVPASSPSLLLKPPSPPPSIEDVAASEPWSIETVYRNASPPPGYRLSMPPPVRPNPDDERWYLGIDIGSTGLCAVLLDQQNHCLYPISWDHREQPNSMADRAAPCFRLPAQMLLVPNQIGNGLNMVPAWGADHSPTQDVLTDAPSQTIVLDRYKQWLNLAIPHYSSHLRRWEPMIQAGGYNRHRDCAHETPLSWFYQSLKSLLSSLSPTSHSLAIASELPSSQYQKLTHQVWGLSEQKATAVLQTLAGVIVGYPASWSAAYRFNVREAVLGARLVPRAAQVLMVNDAIATLLSVLPSAVGRPVTLPDVFQAPPLQTQTDFYGPTLVVNGGAATTELAIANVVPGVPAPFPGATDRLRLTHLAGRSLAYGGDALDQDIIGQLFYSRLTQAAMVKGQPEPPDPSGSLPDRGTEAGAPSCAIDALSLPSAGEPDVHHRQKMHQRLCQSSAGADLLQAARQLKLLLQTQDSATVTLAEQSWRIDQDELSDRVLTPYLQRLQREINALLDETGFQPDEIKHIVCSGGTASLQAIATWLQQTFIQATISQDVYPNDPASVLSYNTVPGCSRVAYGLAAMPLHPTVVDWANRQPCDYDILMELARILPDRPLRLREILELLDQRGISSPTSRTLLSSLLEGQLPPALVPQDITAEQLTPDSNENPAYQELRNLSLFIPVGPGTYVANRPQWMQLQRYLSTLMVGTRQTSFQPQVGMQVH
ncbi:MAG: hypothetical protein AB4042_13775 [Leptolyngbyaceae cyanobacterium]